MRRLRTIVIAALVFTLLPLAGASAGPRPIPKDIKQDRRELRLDRREIRRDRHELRQDRTG